jgi:hypothetical protein
MEAEHAHVHQANATTGDVWVTESVLLGGESAVAMQPQVDDGDFIRENFQVDNATLEYRIAIENPGTYYVWLRVWPRADGNSVYVGIDAYSMRMGVSSWQAPDTEWVWIGMKNAGLRAQVEVTEPGENTFYLWMREDGLYVDRILLTTSIGYVPEGIGPVESPRVGTEVAKGEAAATDDPLSVRRNASGAAAFRIVSMYPNPVRERLHLQFDAPYEAEARLVVYDILGREKLTQDLGRVSPGVEQTLSADLSQFTPGYYMYRIVLENGSNVAVLPGYIVVM